VETVPITEREPLLEGVLGPLAAGEEAEIRKMLLASGDRLDAVARRLHGRVGWHGRGLELHWLPSGQTSIWGSVGAGDAQHAVDLSVELRPGWFYKERSGKAGWVVGLTVDVDCQHNKYCGSMHNVFETERAAATPRESALLLSTAACALEQLAERPFSAWASMGGLASLAR
jgi:hypothetical protein